MDQYTPRNVVIQLAVLITLYICVSFLITLIFGIINTFFPTDTDTYWQIEEATSSVRLGIAMLVVFFPAFLITSRLVQKNRRTGDSAMYQTLTKWLIYLSLLIGGLVMLGTLVTVLYTFLNGDITERFIYKAITVLGVTGIAFHYYLLDARNYWVKHEDTSILFGIGVTIMVLTTIAFGFRYIETPATAYEMKLDETQISDLQNIQWQINSYLDNSSSALPATLEIAYGDMQSPAAPEGREAYTYEVTNKGFKLCATFSRDYQNEFTDVSFSDPAARIKNADNWNYKAGRYCFDRVIK
jgi:hypothetical protein